MPAQIIVTQCSQGTMCQALCKVGHLVVDNIFLILKMRSWPNFPCQQMVKAGFRLDCWHAQHDLSNCTRSSFNKPSVSPLGCLLARKSPPYP